MIREAETSQVTLSHSITRKNAIAIVHPDRWEVMVWTYTDNQYHRRKVIS